MEGFWILCALAAVAVLAWVTAGKISKGKRRREQVLSQFGKRPREEYPLESIPAYARFCPDPQVDDTTWEDLDMDRVFRRINSCQSSVGEQVLYRQLHRLELPAHWEGFLKHLDSRPEERDALWLILSRMGKRRSGYGLPSFLFEPTEVSLFLGPLYGVFAWLPLVSLPVAVAAPMVGGCLLVGTLCWNVVLYYLGKRWVQWELESLQAFSSLLGVCHSLEKTLTFLPLKEELGESLKHFQPILHRLSRFSLPTGSADLDTLQEYLHILTLRDLRLYRRTKQFLLSRTEELHRLFQGVGLVDMAISALSFRATLPQWSSPTFAQENQLEFSGLFHPLLGEPVANDGAFPRDVLLTGSNASGKSTFVKALAVNAILGQSLATCGAERYCFRPGPVVTSMAVRDDITAGESYFVAEVRSLKRLTDTAKTGACLLFIDEILKGTNTVERLAASQAVLEELARRDCVCVAATHDRELTQRLASYANYHFQEEISSQGISFDYKLRPGPANSQNAIRLLELTGFSRTTVQRAWDLAGKGEQET